MFTVNKARAIQEKSCEESELFLFLSLQCRHHGLQNKYIPQNVSHLQPVNSNAGQSEHEEHILPQTHMQPAVETPSGTHHNNWGSNDIASSNLNGRALVNTQPILQPCQPTTGTTFMPGSWTEYKPAESLCQPTLPQPTLGYRNNFHQFNIQPQYHPPPVHTLQSHPATPAWQPQQQQQQYNQIQQQIQHQHLQQQQSQNQHIYQQQRAIYIRHIQEQQLKQPIFYHQQQQIMNQLKNQHRQILIQKQQIQQQIQSHYQQTNHDPVFQDPTNPSSRHDVNTDIHFPKVVHTSERTVPMVNFSQQQTNPNNLIHIELRDKINQKLLNSVQPCDEPDVNKGQNDNIKTAGQMDGTVNNVDTECVTQKPENSQTNTSKDDAMRTCSNDNRTEATIENEKQKDLNDVDKKKNDEDINNNSISLPKVKTTLNPNIPSFVPLIVTTPMSDKKSKLDPNTPPFLLPDKLTPPNGEIGKRSTEKGSNLNPNRPSFLPRINKLALVEMTDGDTLINQNSPEKKRSTNINTPTGKGFGQVSFTKGPTKLPNPQHEDSSIVWSSVQNNEEEQSQNNAEKVQSQNSAKDQEKAQSEELKTSDTPTDISIAELFKQCVRERCGMGPSEAEKKTDTKHAVPNNTKFQVVKTKRGFVKQVITHK